MRSVVNGYYMSMLYDTWEQPTSCKILPQDYVSGTHFSEMHAQFPHSAFSKLPHFPALMSFIVFGPAKSLYQDSESLDPFSFFLSFLSFSKSQQKQNLFSLARYIYIYIYIRWRIPRELQPAKTLLYSTLPAGMQLNASFGFCKPNGTRSCALYVVVFSYQKLIR